LDNFNERNRKEWELRSHLFGASLRGVLFKRLPDVANEHLHNWHKKVILDFIERKDRLKILDVGCGYGRLSIPIIEKFPGVDITGMDISKNYVSLYKDYTNHPAFVGAVEKFPIELGTFDYITCVTVLMYLDSRNLERAILNLLFHLKPDGKLILIEPHSSGNLFQTGCGLLTVLINRIQKGVINTRGRYFRKREIENLFGKAGGRILSERRLPITSLLILPIALIGKLLPEPAAKGIFKVISLFDALLGGLKLPSLYVAYIITSQGFREKKYEQG
jgi:2-polyprenyl-3-methyl-5-hydroxy-6-metoxy-1,4-benzoquinol methylase